MKQLRKLKLLLRSIFAIIILAKICTGEGNEDLSGSVTISGPTIVKINESGLFTATKTDEVDFSGGGWSVNGNTATKTITKSSAQKFDVTCTVTGNEGSYTAHHDCYWVDPKIKKIIVTTARDFYDENSIFNSIGTKYSFKGWEKVNTTITKYPLYHIGGTIISLDVDVEGIPNGLVYDVSLSGNIGGATFSDLNNKSGNSFNISSSGNISSGVKYYNSTSLSWTITPKVSSSATGLDCDAGTTVLDELFVCYGTPTETPTYKRANELVVAAQDNISPETIADEVQDTVPENFGNSGAGGWIIYDEEQGDCDDHARAMKVALDMLGVTAEERLVRASTDSDCSDYQSATIYGYTCYLWYKDHNGGMNRFEGTCYSANYYYAITPILKESTDLEILNEVAISQWWCVTYYVNGQEYIYIIAQASNPPSN